MSSRRINVWRVQANTSPKAGETVNQSSYFIEKGILAVGWSMNDSHIMDFLKTRAIPAEILKLRNGIRTVSDYNGVRKQIIGKEKPIPIYGYNLPANIMRLERDVKPNDLVWLRSKGLYYIARIPEEKKVVFNHDDLDRDAALQIKGLQWICVGDESSVHGSITTAFIAGHALQRIYGDGVQEFSMLIYNAHCGDYYADVRRNLAQKEDKQAALFALLSPSDCEDLLCMYLYQKLGYLPIPSTNKRGTQLYECVLLDPSTDARIKVYPQVKKGKEEIHVADYSGLIQNGRGRVFLFQTEGRIIGNARDDIEIVSPKDIFDFAVCPDHHRYLSDSILNWLHFLEL